MKKKYIGLILIITIIICLIFSISMLITPNVVKIGEEGTSEIIIPDGFKATNSTSHSVVLSNQKSRYTVYEFSNRTFDSIYNEYNTKHINNTVIKSSSQCGNITVYGLTLMIDNTEIHTNYFYEKNGCTYQIYPDGEQNQNILDQLISSTKKIN